ncbi:DUF523 domain-containing protein [Actinomadura logoneensis]|uniref:DUF523 domain-containing protein n=1 Tax=Actinomadura logoneensis TaxID=2293572 RepID=A0A372JU42_9ACTN|nr:DUF523 domain-containing protein [Actinomadura logoneensis]RFU43553.1 DUF523 domain-containing protein [Actinomadura logoneensis]
MERILVSSCLLGRPVRYDGAAKPVTDGLFERWRAEGRLVPVCPEIAGGLPVPRPPAEITPPVPGHLPADDGARIMTDTGEDVTAEFLAGARIALETARRAGARIAVLKESSPSCGSHRVYDGSFTGTRVPGMGVTTALLTSAGIRVFSEDELPEAAAYLAELES